MKPVVARTFAWTGVTLALLVVRSWRVMQRAPA